MNTPPIPPALPIRQAPRQCGLALASLLLGVAGLVCLVVGPLTGIPAVICGHLARSRIRKSGGTLSGAGLALAGLITGYITIVMIAVTGLIAAIAVPHLAKTQQVARDSDCVANLKSMDGSKTAWAIEHKKQPTDIPTDADLFGPDKYMRQKPMCPLGGKYRLNSVQEKPTCSIPGHQY